MKGIFERENVQGKCLNLTNTTISWYEWRENRRMTRASELPAERERKRRSTQRVCHWTNIDWRRDIVVHYRSAEVGGLIVCVGVGCGLMDCTSEMIAMTMMSMNVSPRYGGTHSSNTETLWWLVLVKMSLV